MTLNKFSKTTLLLGSAALLMACSGDNNGKAIVDTAVSYTHLTLPTILLV